MKHSILCVDDEVDNVDALERLFRRKYNVVKATSGAEALEILRKESVALIVSDQRMPGMTGVDFLSAAKERQPDAIRMLLTGYTDIESVISAINSGQIYRYITKPWDPVDLENAVDKAIERYELAGELKKKNIELENALTELRSLDEAKSNFMMLINHELKTPLTSVLSYLELLGETALDAEQKKYASRIAQGADRLKRLVDDTLELVSAETGTMPVKMGRVDLAKIGRALTETFAGPMSERKVRLECDLSGPSPQGDPRALTSVLSRLVDNAVKFASENSTIELASRAVLTGTEVILINRGKAMKPDVLAKILKPFHLDENSMHHSKGTGLGLSIAQAVLKRLGSKLSVVATKGEFRVSFTLASGRP